MSVLLFLFCNPYFVWELWKSDNIRMLLTGVMCIVFMINLDLKSHGLRGLFGLLFLILAFTAIIKGNNFVGLISSVMTCVLPFGKEDFSKSTFNYFVTIYAYIIGISAAMYVLALIHVAPALGTIAPLNELKDYQYSLYPLLVVGNDYRSSIPRFSGVFDEPGVIGTISAIILTIGKFDLKDRRLLVIFFASMLSLSFFYYIVVMVYYLIYNIFVIKNNKNSILIILLFAVFVIFTWNNQVMYETLWSRFAWDSEAGKLAGDNRMGEVGYDFLEAMIGTQEFYFGSKDYEFFEELVKGSASIVSVIVRYGIVFTSIYVYIFTSLGWKYKKNNISFILFVFVFVSTIYQRPFIFDPSYMFLFSVMAMSCKEVSNKKVSIT